ncbi:MAG: hypothetical protein ABIK93_00940 [candidate division WOR-3 bacterium]
MNNLKVAIKIQKVKKPDGTETLKATVPMGIMFEKTFNGKLLEEELGKFEKKYFSLVESLKDILKSIRSKTQKNKVLLYWNFGDKIYNFERATDKETFFLENVTKHLVRDVGVSDKMIRRCRRFRTLYPNAVDIDKERSFDSYVRTFEGGYISQKRIKKEMRE